jgi:tetratricopeptide (TPR) repeat protein
MASPLHCGCAPFLLTLVAWGVLACSSPEAGEHRERADRYRESGDLKAALIEFKTALAKDVHNAQTNFEIAEVLVEMGEPGKAIFYYEETRRLDPTRNDAALAQARIVLRRDPEWAYRLVDEAVDRTPGDIDAQLLLVQIALRQQDLDAGLRAARTAAEFDPDRPEAHSALARVHIAEIRSAGPGEADPALFETAISALDRAVSLQSEEERWQPLALRADLLAMWPGHEEETSGAFRAALDAAGASGKPGPVVGVARGALRYSLARGDMGLRREALERLVVADPRQRLAWEELAHMEREAGGSGEAAYQRFLEARPESADPYIAYASFLVRAGRTEEAVELLEKSSGRVEQPDVVLGALLQFLLGAERREDAERVDKRLRAEHPDSPITAVASAQLLLEDGRVEEAATQLETVVGTHESAVAHHLLAVAHMRSRKLPAARAAVNRAIELDPSMAAARFLRARMSASSGDYKEALDDLRFIARRLRRLEPRDRVLLARCLYETGNSSEGRQILLSLVEGEQPFPPAVVEYSRREAKTDPDRIERLVASFERSRSDDPSVALLFARRDLAQGDTGSALERLDAVPDGGQVPPPLLTLRARLRARAGRHREARADARLAFAEAPGRPEVATLLVMLYGADGRIEEALTLLDAADRDDALSLESRGLLARVHLQDGDPQRGRAILEEVVESDAPLPLARNELAYLLAQEGRDLHRALALASEAVRHHPDDPLLLDTLGSVLLKQNLAEAAARHFQSAVDQAEARGESRAAYFYHLGLAFSGMGRNRSAAEAFARALEIEPDFPKAEHARRARKAALAGRKPDVAAPL